jgi:arsenite methyltransferase
MKEKEIREFIRDRYGRIVTTNQSGCGCGCSNGESSNLALAIGYTEDELSAVPADSNLGLGCGNPGAIAALRAGETVLDLGAGAGFDCFLAAQRVGPGGMVIGVDMTPPMVEKSREHAAREGITNVEFRLGEIEHLPVADNTIDVIISNCVLNLSVDKAAVFREMARVLKTGGRVAVSDIVLLKELPRELADNLAALTGCVAGAISADEYIKLAKEAGLKEARIDTHTSLVDAAAEMDPTGQAFSSLLPPGEKLSDYVTSADFSAVKA